MLQACILAIIAGYADTIGYIRYEAFAGLMTGNTIFLGMEIANGKLMGAAFHGGIIVTFLIGVIVSRTLILHEFEPFHALSLTSVILIVCGFLPHGIAAFLLALAMGMQNSAANRFNGVALNTVFVTGNLQKLGEGIVGWIWSTAEERKTHFDGAAIFGSVWAAYAAGALVGAFANKSLTYPLLLPALVLPFVMPLGKRSTPQQ